MPTIFERWVEELRDDPEFVAEGLLIDLGEQVVRRMDELHINRTELAGRMGVKPPYVTKVLRGANVSMVTLAKFAIALECEPSVALQPRADQPLSQEEAPAVGAGLKRSEAPSDRWDKTLVVAGRSIVGEPFSQEQDGEAARTRPGASDKRASSAYAEAA